VATYRRLADAPSRIRTASLEDALLVEERTNVPGTTDEHPNWSLALPAPLEAIVEDPVARAVAASMRTPDRPVI
jgi:4-alpha-glucanotransferase